MVENADKTLSANEREAQSEAPAKPRQFDHTRVTGRFNQYTSGYWALALPALAARYVARYTLGLFGIDDPKKLNPRYAGIVGTWMGFITSFYAKRTYDDMKRVFSEPLAWELDKKPEDIGLRDLWKSKNDIVNRTMHNYVKRNLMRVGVSASFFARFLPWKPFKNAKADSVDLGTGATGSYLVSDVFLRKETFFEKLQNIIDNKINHHNSVGEVITSSDLMNLYVRHERDINSYYQPPQMNSQQWRDDQVLFTRMAELMNETYCNMPQKEAAGFTIPKLLYLLGNGLINTRDRDQSLAYVEIANRSDDMREVKDVKRMLAAGANLDEVLQKFAVTLPAAAPETAQAPAEGTPRFTDRIAAPEGREAALRTLAATQGSHAEKARKSGENGISAAGIV